MSITHKVLYGLVGMIIIIVLIMMADSSTAPQQSPFLLDIKTPSGIIHTRIVTTDTEKEKGLGGRDSLPADQGMIFGFAEPGTYGFWMKDMRFAIDIVWIDAHKEVVGISSNISPDTYPESFMPPSSISYVLELNAGQAEKFGIATGTVLTF